MKIKTILLAGLTILAPGLSSAFARGPHPSPGVGHLVNTAAGLSDFGGDALAVGLFAIVLVLGACFGRCYGNGKKD